MEKQLVVISGVNLTEGGPLSILQDAVNSFISHVISDYRLVILVHKKSLLGCVDDNDEVKVLEYGYPKKAWLLRVWFEYIHCYFMSKKIKPHLWISLHDVTPNVKCDYQVVYCHNPAPFYKVGLKDFLNEKSLFFFHFFYGIFYRLNIRSNKYVIVQQQWMREEFQNRYQTNNTIVSYPDVAGNKEIKTSDCINKRFRFFYPSIPRSFKNFEVLLSAASLLEERKWDFEVIVTFDGSENSYTSNLKKKYTHLSSVKFIGQQNREDIFKLYSCVSCLVFASTMETWGLPITEMKLFNKPMLLADCKYAHETAGDYDKACFFEPKDFFQLSELMQKAIDGTLQFSANRFTPPSPPFAKTWKELFALILN